MSLLARTAPRRRRQKRKESEVRVGDTIAARVHSFSFAVFCSEPFILSNEKVNLGAMTHIIEL
jgi:hypothetical protein